MATYRISGVWKDTDNIITAYAIHSVSNKTISKAIKYSKAEAIELVESTGNTVTTLQWNYSTRTWTIGEKVIVAKRDGRIKYLKTTPDDQLKDNLGHLISMRAFNCV